MSGLQNNIIYYLKNPFVCAGLISILTYIIYSNNYMNKKNVKERIPMIKQRTANLKSAIYVFLVATVVIFLYRYASTEIEEEATAMLSGSAPF